MDKFLYYNIKYPRMGPGYGNIKYQKCLAGAQGSITSSYIAPGIGANLAGNCIVLDQEGNYITVL